jgi:hypothetical protein
MFVRGNQCIRDDERESRIGERERNGTGGQNWYEFTKDWL